MAHPCADRAYHRLQLAVRSLSGDRGPAPPPEAHGFAIDLIKFRDEYRAAFWYVFGDTIVVDGLDDARRLMGGVRLVDLKGSLIEAGGAMRGGSRPKTSLSFSNVDRGKLEITTQQLQDAISSQDILYGEIANLKKEIVEL